MKRAVSFVFVTMISVLGFETMASAHPEPRFRADRKIEVEWGASWRPSSIVAVRDGQYLVHYDGWDTFFDEWVPESRVRYADGVVDCEGQPQLAQIQWGGMWRSGRIMKTGNGQFLVHYDGWDTFFDEWVGADKVVLVQPARPAYVPPSYDANIGYRPVRQDRHDRRGPRHDHRVRGDRYGSY